MKEREGLVIEINELLISLVGSIMATFILATCPESLSEEHRRVLNRQWPDLIVRREAGESGRSLIAMQARGWEPWAGRVGEGSKASPRRPYPTCWSHWERRETRPCLPLLLGLKASSRRGAGVGPCKMAMSKQSSVAQSFAGVVSPDLSLRPKPSIAQKFLGGGGISNLGDVSTGSMVGFCRMRSRRSQPTKIGLHGTRSAVCHLGPASRTCFQSLVGFN